MKKSLILISLALLVFASCKRESNHNGLLTFWSATNCNCGPITISCGDHVQQMKEYYPNGTPACGSPGTANFNIAAGTYNYTASCPAASWSGTVSVTEGNCTMQQIVCTTGNVTFWTDSAGNSISVSVGGQTLNITGADSTSIPACGASGCANFLLPTGTYTYSATSASNSWTGQVVVANDSCTLVKIL